MQSGRNEDGGGGRKRTSEDEGTKKKRPGETRSPRSDFAEHKSPRGEHSVSACYTRVLDKREASSHKKMCQMMHALLDVPESISMASASRTQTSRLQNHQHSLRNSTWVLSLRREKRGPRARFRCPRSLPAHKTPLNDSFYVIRGCRTRSAVWSGRTGARLFKI